MSTSISDLSDGADAPHASAPYAFPQSGSASLADGSHERASGVGPYVPEPWRGTFDVAQPVAVLVGEPMASVEPPAALMPPSYPTPAYFTPLATLSQADFDTPAFELPAIIDAIETLFVVTADASSVEPTASTVAEHPSLPWIDAFLASTPATPMLAVDEPIEVDTEREAWPMPEAAPEAPTPSDAWALDDAAQQLRSLVDELRDHEGIAEDVGERATLFDEPSTPGPLPAWTDDDMIDIMPVQIAHSPVSTRVPTPGSIGAIEPWAERARRVGDDNAEAAAKALEMLARRVRAGEISLVGYEPRLGEAATLAAALAALLGVRR